jgi:hypothetical protein
MQRLSDISKSDEVITIVHDVQWFFRGVTR